jgi:molybdopterin-guanine dinucleotide biosynthesis protein A
MTPPDAIYGLVLAGGRSTRMHRDKAALAYHGRSQLAETFARLSVVTQHAFVSVRADQTADPLRSAFPQIVDRTLVDGTAVEGPLAGILAAQAMHPEVAWLVVACDLPFLDEAVLRELVARRNPRSFATAFRSAHDGLPEPLCAIWEPRSATPLAAYAAAHRNCPRKFLIESGATLLDLPNARALDNVNSAADYWQTMSTLDPNSLNCTVHVQYFALLREQAGTTRETLTTPARNPRELYDALRLRHPFTLDAELLRVAVNGEFGDWQQPLAEGDTVVFIPPVAGG